MEQTYALVINDLNNGRQTPDEFAVGEEDNAADFDVAPMRDFDVDICHLWQVAAQRLISKDSRDTEEGMRKLPTGLMALKDKVKNGSALHHKQLWW